MRLLLVIAVVLGGVYVARNHEAIQAQLDQLGDLGLQEPAKVTPLAKRDIPDRYRSAYQRGAKQCPGLHWTVVAAVGKKESNHGRFRGNGVQRGRNPGAGERGPAQFTDPAWAQHGRGGNPYKPEDAFAAVARKLCHDGAPTNTRRALRRYNGRWSYADDALAWADRYRTGALSP